MLKAHAGSENRSKRLPERADSLERPCEDAHASSGARVRSLGLFDAARAQIEWTLFPP
jgi:hypothetical protein